MAISWYIVRICTISQEIAPQAFPSVTTAFGLAMTEEVGSRRGFAGGRRSIGCIPRNGTGAVPYRPISHLCA